MFEVGAVSEVVDTASVDMSIITEEDPNDPTLTTQTLSADVQVDDSSIEIVQ